MLSSCLFLGHDDEQREACQEQCRRNDEDDSAGDTEDVWRLHGIRLVGRIERPILECRRLLQNQCRGVSSRMSFEYRGDSSEDCEQQQCNPVIGKKLNR